MRMTPTTRRLPALMSLALASVLSTSALAVTYQARDIGRVEPYNCYINEMNARGQIVGACLQIDGYTSTGFATDAKGKNIHTVGLLSGTASWVNGLNDAGVLVGDASLAGDVDYHAWVKQPDGPMVDLGTLGGSNSFALNINSKGLIVGSSMFDASWNTRGFVILPGTTTMIDIGSLGGTRLFAWEVNNKGVIGGYGDLPGDTETRAFYAKPPYTKLIMLDSLGGSVSAVHAINDNGGMVGTTRTPGDVQRRGFVAQVGSKEITELATPAGLNAGAFGINNLGRIVGVYARASDNKNAPFSCSGDCSDFVDLNTVTTGLPQGVELRTASDVNDKGMISAQASDGHIYLLTPK